MKHNFNRFRFFNTIKFKLSALFCTFTITLSTLAGASFYDHKKETLMGQAKEKAGSLSQNLAKNAGAALLDGDEMQLSVLVFTEVKDPSVLSAAILDHEGKALIHSDIKQIGKPVLSEGGKKSSGAGSISDKLIKEIKPIWVDGKKIGSAILTIDLSAVLEQTRKLKAALVAGAFLFCALGCYLIIHVTGRLLDPLGSLSRAVSRVGKGELDVQVDVGGGEEIRELGTVFNQMTQGLAKANQQVEEGYLQSVMALSAAVEAKDPYTRGHCDRVAYYAEQVARHMGLDEAVVNQLILAGQLHDLGKIGVDKEILCKPGRLDDDEFDHIAKHPMIAWQILEPARFLDSVRDIIIVHHERYDGKGYPNGLAGDEICLAGRILAVADCYDAMTSNRPYRKHLGEHKALNIIREEKAQQFDPDIVDAFLDAYPVFEERESLDRRLEISSRGRVWVYDDPQPVIGKSTDPEHRESAS